MPSLVSKISEDKHLSLDESVVALSAELVFQKPERLALLIRRTIKFLLSELPEEIQFKNAPEAIRFTKRPTISANEFILDFYDGAEELPSIAILFHDGTFRGKPKNCPKITDVSQMPPLVTRRQIYARSYRKYIDTSWKTIADENGERRIVTDFEIG